MSKTRGQITAGEGGMLANRENLGYIQVAIRSSYLLQKRSRLIVSNHKTKSPQTAGASVDGGLMQFAGGINSAIILPKIRT